ncbi:MAG: site-specific integrase [Lachnospiraceae bacterium]|nr:site-specific integrase [Lachnospiraceae bacterium]
MASERLITRVRKDKKGRVLLKGEYQYPNGRYEYTYTNADGKKDKVYSWCLTQTDKPPKGKECEECLRVMEARLARDVQDGISTKKARKQTLDALFEQHIVLRPLKDSTRTNYIYMYNKYISPVFGSRKVSTIRNSEIKAFYGSLIHELGFKPNSMEVINTILHPIFQQAVMDDTIRKNPTDGAMAEIKRSHDWEKPKRSALTEEEQEAFVEYVSNSDTYSHWMPIFTLLLGTGLRIGEATGLRWQDIDFDNDMISVNHNLVYRQDDSGKCDYRVTTPKTKNSVRVVPMVSDVRKALLKERMRQYKDGTCKSRIVGDDGNLYEGFIFYNRFGFVYNPHVINCAIDRIVRDFNAQEAEKAEAEHREPLVIRHFSVHNLRHTFCTRFCENEANLKVIQEIMGHADISTTMDIYNEATEKKKKESFAALEGKIKIS